MTVRHRAPEQDVQGVPGVPPPGAHGGDAAVVARALGVDPESLLDLSASLNPFAPDPVPVLRRHLESGVLARYPDDGPARTALAAAMGVDPARLVLTNGGAEAIALVAAEIGRGEVVEPEFALYRRYLPVVEPGGARVRSNPHNPTGVLAPADEVAAVWDEAFYPLATGTWTRGDADRGSVVVGSLTKLLSCPGLRLGYVLAPDERFAAAIERRRPAWSVNGLAAAALGELLGTVDLAGWARAVARARRELTEVLVRAGLVVSPSDANWVLASGVPDLRARLVRHGVLVRDCTSFGMPGTVRVAVPDADGLARLDAALVAVTKTVPDHGVPEHGRGTPRHGMVR